MARKKVVVPPKKAPKTAGNGVKSKSKKMTVGALKREYSPVVDHADSRRAADFLNFCAGRWPGVPIYWNWVTQMVFGRKRTPNMLSREVEALRQKASGIRRILLADYKRDLISVPKMEAVRATVDHADMLRNSLERRSRGLQGAANRLTQIYELIDLSKVPKSAENRPYIDWAGDSVAALVKQVSAPAFSRKCLPPVPDDE